MKQLRNIADYVSEKVKVANADKRYYISTDNMLPSKEGITETVSFPESGSATQYRKDDVLVSNIRPYFKKIWYAANDGSCSNDVLVFRPKNSNQTDSKFLYYLLAQDIFFEQMMAGANGTKMPRGNKKLIPNFEIPDYDLPTQKRIASILSAYDDLIEVNRKQIKLLEEAAERLYREWFIDLRFPGHETTTFNADGLPEGWNSYKIDDAFSIKYGKNLATTKLLDKALYPVYGANGVIGRYEKKTHSDYVTLITSRGNGSGNVSRTYDKEAYITNNSFVVEPEKKFVYCGKEYTYYLIKNVYFKGVVSGSAQPQLTNMGISTLSIVIAEKGLIEKFNKITESIFAEIVVLKQQIIQAAAARDLLLPKLMNGEIQL